MSEPSRPGARARSVPALLITSVLLAAGMYLLRVLDLSTWRGDLGIGCLGAAGAIFLKGGWLR